MIITKHGRIIGEINAQFNAFGKTVWDAHAINPDTGEKKFLGTFADGSAENRIDAASLAVKKITWKDEAK